MYILSKPYPNARGNLEKALFFNILYSGINQNMIEV